MPESPREQPGSIRLFAERHFTHFNSRELLAAARAYETHLDAGGKMLVTLAGAMSTAGIGRTLARMIREEKVHAISCTGANLEEDVFRLLAGDEYESIPDWRGLSAWDEQALHDRGMNRVNDTAVPETAMREVERRMRPIWQEALDSTRRYLPHELFWRLLDEIDEAAFQRPPEDSWLIAAKDQGIPIVTPGWEDSTLGNIFTAWAIRNQDSAAHLQGPHLQAHRIIRFGTEALADLAQWYRQHCHLNAGGPSVGLFQIGGGIAGDFPLCVVPMMIQDMGWADTPHWGYFTQITDAVTSYGGYSGASANEKITWAKLTPDTPRFTIESDATLVAPLIFGYVLGD